MKQIHSFLSSFTRRHGAFVLLFIFLIQIVQGQSVSFQYDKVGNLTGRTPVTAAAAQWTFHPPEREASPEALPLEGPGVASDTISSPSVFPGKAAGVTYLPNYSAAYSSAYQGSHNPQEIEEGIEEIPFTSQVVNGSITYQVPIEVYPGRHDFHPALSLMYNSTLANGVAGYGWMLGGLSSIMPVHGNYYFDAGVQTPEALEGPYALDGNRLIEIGTNKYQTEQGFIEVTRDKYCFRVTYPDGRKAIYGYTGSTSYALSYPLVEVTDPAGNFIKYTYSLSQNVNNITSISYGNNGTEIGRVDFIYKTRDDVTAGYLAGQAYSQTQLLAEIKVYHLSSRLRSYKLTHNKDVYHFLKRIDCNVAGTPLKPVTFNYGIDTAQPGSFRNTDNFMASYFPNNVNMINVQKFKGNGKKATDGLITHPIFEFYGWTKVDSKGNYEYRSRYPSDQSILVYPDLSGNNLSPVRLTTGSDFYGLLTADYNGDGDEELIHVKYGPALKGSLYVSRITVKIMDRNGKQLSTFNHDIDDTFKEGSYVNASPRSFFVGDFNGSGKPYLLAVSSNKTPTGASRTSFVTLINLENPKNYSHAPSFSANIFEDHVFLLDFDGNGTADIGVVSTNGTNIYSLLGGSMRQIASTGSIYNSMFTGRNKRTLLLGDINGDGKTDIVVSPPSNRYTTRKKHLGDCQNACEDGQVAGTSADGTIEYYVSHSRYCNIYKGETERVYSSDAKRWDIYYSTGKGFVNSTLSHSVSDDGDESFLLYDVNGDNLPDLVVNSAGTLSVYLNENGNIHTRPAASIAIRKKAKLIPLSGEHSWYSGMRNSQLVAVENAYVNNLTFLRNDGMRRKLSAVTGSMGVKDQIEYAVNSDPNVYSTETTKAVAYPENVIISDHIVVQRHHRTVSGKTLMSHSYKYNGAVVNRLGLGFGGYEKIVMTDNMRGRSMTTQYAVTGPGRGMPLSVDAPLKSVRYEYLATRDHKNFRFVGVSSLYEKDNLTGLEYKKTFTYDSYYNVSRDVSYPVSNVNNQVVTDYKYHNTHRRGELYDLVKTTTYNGHNWTERTYIPSFHASTRQPLQVINYVGENGDKKVSDVTYTYDKGNVITEISRLYDSPDALTVTYAYDAYGRKVKETDALGLTTSYTYNDRALPESVINHKGNKTTYSYLDGHLSRITHPDGTEESYSYEWDVNSPVGALYVHRKSSTGQPVVSVHYNAQGEKIRTTSTALDGSLVYTDYRYDTYGRLNGETQPYKAGMSARWNTWKYDTYDRPTEVTQVSGNTSKWDYNKLSVTQTENGISTTRTMDETGSVVSVNDLSGTAIYRYRADGQPVEVTTPGGIKTTFGYDAYGRKVKMVDPSFGETNYTYDAAGNMIREVDAVDKKKEYTYDAYRRLVTTTLPDLSINYTFDSDGMLKKETASNGTYTEYTYDALLRVSKVKEVAPDNKWLQKELTYADGRVGTVKYTSQSGVIATVDNSYSQGRLEEQKLNGSTSFFKLTAENVFGRPVTVQTGGVTRTYEYDAYGTLTSRMVKAGATSIQHFGYVFDANKGNLTSRTDVVRNRPEAFKYDTLNRLTRYAEKQVAYDVKGNILQKSDAGELGYGSILQPYSVTSVTNSSSMIPVRSQQISYYSFKRPHILSENGYKATFTYNGAFDRKKMRVEKNGAEELTRYYLGGCYELDTKGGQNVKEKLYLGGNYYTAPAVYVKEGNGSWQLYNICRDHLGSITHITAGSGSAVKQELSYDAWGSLRNPDNHTLYKPGEEPVLFLGRGYTGHEHLPWFGLVNMNARLYNPVTGRFLAPDPYVQAPDFLQNYNRYSYCMNNPLVYVDEDGEWIHIVIGAAVGGIINLSVKAFKGQIRSVGDGFVAFGIGAAAGAIGAATGGAAFAAAGGAAGGVGGFVAGAAGSAAGSAVAMPIQSGGNTLYFGDPFMTWQEYLIGVGGSALTGGTINGSMALLKGNNFWTGKDVAFGRGAFSFNNTPTRPAPEMQALEAPGKPQVSLGEKVATGKNDFFEESHLSRKVLNDISRDKFHGFPKSVDGYAAEYGKHTIEMGSDGKFYHWLRLDGTYNGKVGTFEYIKNFNGEINHRFFNIKPTF